MGEKNARHVLGEEGYQTFYNEVINPPKKLHTEKPANSNSNKEYSAPSSKWNGSGSGNKKNAK
jgi:hypothetical protein